MSRIAKYPVAVPDKVQVTIDPSKIVVKGPLGTLEQPLARGVVVKLENNQVTFGTADDSQQSNALSGTMRANVANMVKGVKDGFQKKLTLVGVLGADAIWGLRGRAWPALLGAAAGGTLFVIALGINAATAPSWGVDKYLVWPAIPGMTALVANELAVAFTPARASARTRSAVTWMPSLVSSASGGPWGIQVTGRF